MLRKISETGTLDHDNDQHRVVYEFANGDTLVTETNSCEIHGFISKGAIQLDFTQVTVYAHGMIEVYEPVTEEAPSNNPVLRMLQALGLPPNTLLDGPDPQLN